MSNFEVKIDASDVLRRFKNAPSIVPSAIEMAITILLQNAHKMAVEGCPVAGRENQTTGYMPYLTAKKKTPKVRKRKTGMLRLSLGIGKPGNIYKRDTAKHKVEFGSNLKYAPSIIENTGPYKIRPKNKKVLWFAVGPTPNDIVYAKEVTHPGGRAITGNGGDALLPRTAKEVERTAPTILQQVINKIDFFK